MRKFYGAFLALMMILILGLSGWYGCSHKPAQVIPTPTPTPVIPLTFNQRVDRFNPSLKKYVKKLYKHYSDNAWKYQRWDKLHQYVLETHKKAEIQYNFPTTISRKETSEIVYGIKTYTKHWKLNEDWSIAYLTHEAGFLDIIGDKINYKTHLPNPPSIWSIGMGEEEMGTAYGNLKARGIDPTGLTVDDLLYFRLVNLDISICVMAAKVRHLGYKNGTQAYNAGDYSWHDGRSYKYYKNILAIYSTRAKWGGKVETKK